MRYIVTLFILILVAFAFYFSLMNAGNISIVFGTWRFNMPLVLSLYLCLVMGIVLGWGVGLMSRLRLMWRCKRLQAQTKEA